MLPPGHLAVAYLCYSLLVRVRLGGRVSGVAVVVVALASQTPDLVDKPLSWWLGVLPTGRSLMHSLVILVPLAVAVYWVAQRRGYPRLGIAFGIGAIAHAGSDAAMSVLAGGLPTFLLWPILPVTGYESGAPSIIVLLIDAYTAGLFSNAIALEGTLVVLAAVAWVMDGTPGLSTATFRTGSRETPDR